MVRALVSQGKGFGYKKLTKDEHKLTTPFGRPVNSYVFGRSFQETERSQFGTVEKALDGNDKNWRDRELIIMPSHVTSRDHQDVRDMIEVAHGAGFDTVAVSIILSGEGIDNRRYFPPIWNMDWDTRWTVPNPWCADPKGQLEALGRDLWFWISNALVR